MLLLTLINDRDETEIGSRRWPVCPQLNTYVTYDYIPWYVIGAVHSDWVTDPENSRKAIAEIILYVEPMR